MTLNFDGAAQLLHEVLGDVETKTDSLLVDGLVLLHNLTEQLEQAALVLLADSNSRVVNLKLNGVFDSQDLIVPFQSQSTLLDGHLNVALESELGGVSEQVDHNLLESLVVGLDFKGHVFGDTFQQVDALFEPQLHVNQRDHFIGKLPHIHRLIVHLELA